VAIEFTAPDAAAGNVLACARASCPVVVGTTGWGAELPMVRAEVDRIGGALLHAPNFSFGVAIFERVVAEAARLFAAVPSFEAHLVETHHRAKKDAPSGTAAALARSARAASGRPLPITSVRVGSVPGTHEVVFDAPFEQVRLVHEARDRRVFAEGALAAAHWLVGRRGVFTMQDVLASPSPTPHTEAQ
jgi:4-hydroxy-tetrahydrodipicolinate reductase